MSSIAISILISRNYEGVSRCLNSIRPIMGNVSSELILTDTGCGDKVRKLLEEYVKEYNGSAKILEFEWIKDFSAARNLGLEEAKRDGCEWFLYIDDDEWFEESTLPELIDFFNSGECDKYNVAAYIQRNYLNMEGSEWGDHNADRILRINPKLHFERRIHEAYTGIDIGQKKKLNTIAHHYGYVYNSEEERIAKSKRNRELLYLEVKEHPEDMRMRYQLVMDCYGVGEYDAAIEAALEGIKLKSDSQYWDAIHTDLLYCYQAKKEWETLISYGTKFLSDNLFPFDEFGVRQYLIGAYWSIGSYDKVCHLAPKVIATYRDYKKNPKKYDANQLMRDEFWQTDNISKMLLYITDSALATEDESVIELLNSYDIKEEMSLLTREDPYKTWLMQMAVGTCIHISQVELFGKLQIATRGNARYIKAKCYDNILRNVAEHIKDMDEYDSLEYVLAAMTEYADTMIYYCEDKYGDKLNDMNEDELADEERIAWDIQDVINSVDTGDVHGATGAVRRLMGRAPYWSDAIKFLPTYIQLVLG